MSSPAWYRGASPSRMACLIGVGALLASTGGAAPAAEPDLALSQLVDRSWTREQGLVSESIWCLAETRARGRGRRGPLPGQGGGAQPHRLAGSA